MKNDNRQPTKAGWRAAGRTAGGGLPTCWREGQGTGCKQATTGRVGAGRQTRGRASRRGRDWWLGLGRGYELGYEGGYWAR